MIEDNTDDKINIMTDQIVYNPYKQEVQLLNTKRCLRNDDPVITKLNIHENQTVTLYTFGSNSILLVINNEEE